jgi:hypothetical protein
LKQLKTFVVTYFEDLKGVLRSYNKDLNQLTLQILIITEKMVNLGFLQNDKEYLNLMQPLISLLDGSNDFNSQSEEQAFNLEI